MTTNPRPRFEWPILAVALAACSMLAARAASGDEPKAKTRPAPTASTRADLLRTNRPLPPVAVPSREADDRAETSPPALPLSGSLPMTQAEIVRAATSVGLFALLSLVPAAVLMVTAYVRISIVLTLLRQALGSPQIPGNQVLTALALLLTALVMRPVADQVYTKGIAPYAADPGKVSAREAWKAGTGPIKTFMIEQIHRTHHEQYLRDLYELTTPGSEGRGAPADCEQLSLGIVAPAFLLSELTTALVIGFSIYLPFLIIDLVVSAVLAAMGLVMLPPSLVSLPLKLIAFVLADGWWLVASMLLRSFGQPG